MWYVAPAAAYAELVTGTARAGHGTVSVRPATNLQPEGFGLAYAVDIRGGSHRTVRMLARAQ